MVLLAKEFSKIIPIEKINNEPISYQLTASDDVCKHIVERLDIVALHSYEAEVSLSKRPDLKAILVEGTVQAEVEQACILTGTPVPESINDTFKSYFVANEEILEELERRHPSFLYEDVEILEEPFVDAAELVTQYLSLFLNPYPKKQGVDVTKLGKAGLVIKSEEDAAKDMREARNPFKVLRKLKED
jgi:uncharacterized metal-binding protein YceD (DUF177 family)